MSEPEKNTQEQNPAQETPVQAETDQKPRKKGKEKKKRTVGQEIVSWVLTLLVAVAAALLIRTFIFEPVRVDGHSMDDTLNDGEIMFVTKFDYSSTWLCFPWQSQEDQEKAVRFTLHQRREV